MESPTTTLEGAAAQEGIGPIGGPSPSGTGAVPPDGNGGTPETPPKDPMEEAFLRYGGVSQEQITRATRIQGRMNAPRPLGEILLELGFVTEDQVEAVERRRRAQMTLMDLLQESGHLTDEIVATYQRAKASDPPPSDREILLDGGLVPEEDFLQAVGAKLSIPFIEPQIGEIQTSLFEKVPIPYLLKNLVLPIRVDDGVLKVAVAYPEDEAIIIEMERTFSKRVERYCATRSRITTTLQTLDRLRGNPSTRDVLKIQYREIGEAQDEQESGEEAIHLVDYLLGQAVQMGASDLHIEPTANHVRVRVRVDGVLHQLTDLPVDFTARVIARIKILARVDVTEKRLHQDGKIHIKVSGREIDIRVSTYVSMFGETVVMRLLDRDRGILPLETVGFQKGPLDTLRDVVLKASSGLVLTVGPTGSGKTTTLYSFVDYANDPSEKVITCEDPVEYVIEGIVQCSVNERTGPTFPDSLRAIVRQDPDTIVVGEIRDPTTANLAVESALTGHKVLSTFHTEEAVGAFVRLLEMGVEPFLVASTVSAVVAQRLVRLLCPDCKEPRRPTPAQIRFLSVDRLDIAGIRFQGPKGCSRCNGTGYKGRVAIHEVLIPNAAFREAVLNQTAAGDLRAIARTLPEFLTMQEDGLLKASAGTTSLDEIIENAPRDPDARSYGEIIKIAQNRRR